MAYSVMIWLTDPGPQAREEEALARSEAARETAPGAAAGVNEPPAFTRLVYGVYDDEAGAEEAESGKAGAEGLATPVLRGVAARGSEGPCTPVLKGVIVPGEMNEGMAEAMAEVMAAMMAEVTT